MKQKNNEIKENANNDLYEDEEIQVPGVYRTKNPEKIRNLEKNLLNQFSDDEKDNDFDFSSCEKEEEENDGILHDEDDIFTEYDTDEYKGEEYNFYREENNFSQDENGYSQKCEHCQFNKECKLIKIETGSEENSLEEVPYYRIEEYKNCPFKKYNFQIHKCCDKRVADVIIEDEFKNWNSNIPVFISAQMGKGKNYFIENKLLRYVEEMNIDCPDKKVLILSNRIALREQTKNRIDRKFPFVKVLSYQSLLEYVDSPFFTSSYSHIICDEAHFFTSDAMFNPTTNTILTKIVEAFKNSIRIYMTATPNEVLEFICEAENISTHDQIREIVLDREEVVKELKSFRDYAEMLSTEDSHSDSKALDNKREDARIGLEAAKLDRIFQEELDNYMIYYHFERDYSYLNIKYFSNYKELYHIIARSKEKWLIFIDSKKECEKVKRELLNSKGVTEQLLDYESEYSFKEDNIFVMNSKIKREAELNKDKDDKSKKIYESYQHMIKNESFQEDILITTSVLDNGVNFKNKKGEKKLNNIVISDINKAKVLQMLGRIRIKKKDKINLYLKRFDSADIEYKIEDLDEKKNIYYDYDMAYNRYSEDSEYAIYKRKYFYNKYYNGEIEDFEDAKHLFERSIVNPERVRPNEISHSLVYNSLTKRYDSILHEMQETDTGEEYAEGQKYLEYQLDWFDTTYNKENDITFNNTGTKREKFAEYVETLLDSEIPENEKKRLSNDFRSEFQKMFHAGYGFRTKSNGFNTDDNTTEAIKDGYDKSKINDVLDVLYENGKLKMHLEIYKDKEKKVYRFRRIDKTNPKQELEQTTSDTDK